ncbi:MAG: SMP-30/gluconolactonase/LRE family protein [Halioglobus sp.]
MTETIEKTELHCVWNGKAELGEGVFWHEEEQAVYWVDIMQSNLYRLAVDGSTDYWHFPGQLSCVVPCSTGGLLATFEDGLSHLDLDTATVTLLAPLETELPDNRLNDGCSDTRGQFWFGSMDNNQRDPSGSFYRMDRNGDVARVESFGQVCISNGPTFSADGQWVYFTDSVEKKVYRAPLQEDGRAGTPQLHLQFGEQDGFPDGMCTDTDGGLWICHFAGGRVTRFMADGEVDQVIEMPVPNITKCAFGGHDLRTLYITTAATSLNEEQREQYPLSGGLFAIKLPYTGTPMMPVVRASGKSVRV